jgi:glucokinase
MLRMNQGYPRLLGDIGGTNVRWAWQESADGGLEDISIQPCDASVSLQDSALHYLVAHGRSRPPWAGLGVAAPVVGDEVRFTNNSWQFSISGFREALSLERCLVINDFTALALSLPALKSVDLRVVGTGTAVAGSTVALLGPGTGLGVSGLVPDSAGRYIALGGEGGHATLAASDDVQQTLLAILRKRFQHVSAERVLSGAGLVNLYQAICAMEGCAAHDLQPAEVTDGAVAGADAQCSRAVRYFTQFLGNVAGNLALTLGSRGGVYIGGGIVPRLGSTFDDVVFRQSFEDKGRYRGMLAAMPVWVITASTPALLGASRALDTLA